MTSPQHQIFSSNGAEPAEPRSATEWLLLLFWRQKRVLILALIMAGVGAWAYLRNSTPLYTSTARLLVKPASKSALAPSQGNVNGVTSTFNNTQMEVIRSDAVLSLAGAMLAEDSQTRGEAPTLPTREMIDVELGRSTDIISITAKHPSSVHAAALTAAVVEAYRKFSSNGEEPGKVPQMLQRYEDELDAADRNLKKKQDELQAMEAEHGPSVRQDERNSLEQRRLDSVNAQLITTELELKKAERDADAARRALGRLPDTPATQPAVGDPLDEEVELGIGSVQEQQALRLEIIQAQSQLIELAHKHAEDHPAVVTLARRVERLNTTYLLGSERREGNLRAQADVLRRQYEQARDEILKLNTRAQAYAYAKAEADKLQQIRDQYDARVRELKLEPDTGGVSIAVVDRAGIADKPSLPDKRKVMVIAIAMGLAMGMVLAALREWLDDRMRSPGEIRSSLGIPLLSVIPRSPTNRSFSVSGQRVLLDPASDAAEAYRALRTAIQFSAPAGLKTLMVSSPNSGDGKTTLVTNLGIAWAQSGKKVCIVDSDLRNPTVHDIFSLKTTLGLSTLLAGRSSLEGSIQHTSVNGLDVLPCGPVPANPAEILNSQEFAAALESLADRYDVVLLDSPPVMSATDSRMIAASTDATLIVLTAQSAHRRTTEQTRDALESVGARIIGLVVNDVPRKSGRDYGTPRATRTTVPGLTSQEYDVLQVRK